MRRKPRISGYMRRYRPLIDLHFFKKKIRFINVSIQGEGLFTSIENAEILGRLQSMRRNRSNEKAENLGACNIGETKAKNQSISYDLLDCKV